MRTIRIVTPFFLLLLIACSETPTSKPATNVKPEKKQPQLLMGREAFQKMYISAHIWAPDAKPYMLESVVNSESSGKDGKATVWRSGFASLSKRAIRSFLWSGSALPEAPESGVSAGVADMYEPSNSSTQAFDFAFLKVDSDKAYEVALKHGGDKLIKAKPDQPVMYTLDWNGRQNLLTWHVIFGTDLQDAKLRIAVNASTGDYIRTEK